MKYVMKKKMWSLTDKFTIQDEAGREAFHIDGKFMSMRDSMTLMDAQGNEVASIQHKLLSWGPTYEIYHGGQLVAVVKEKIFSFMGHQFFVEGPGEGDLHAQGNFTDHEYVFTRDGRQVATVSKAWFAWTDTFGVDVSGGEDPALILATTVVIDKCTEQQHHSGFGGTIGQ